MAGACEHPVFVVGPPRSGTETLQWALRQHPDLWGGERSGFLETLLVNLRGAYRHGTAAGPSQLLAGLGVTWEEFAAAVGAGVNVLITGRAGGKRWVDQTDRYVHHLDDLAAMFPGAAYLVMQRDGRAAVDAMRRQVEPVAHEEACRRWAEAVAAASAWEAGGGRAHTVSFEKLVGDPEGTLAAAFRHLGLGPSREAVAFVTGRAPRHAARRPPAWAGWTRPERQAFSDVAGELLIRLGYAHDDSWVEAEPG